MLLVKNLKGSNYLIFGILVASLFLVSPGMLPNVSAASRQSDVATTPYGTEYYLTATGKNTTFANNSINSFMVSVDVIQFGENVSGWYDVRLGYRLRNEALGWSMVVASDNTALISQSQPWYDFVFDVYVNASFPSAFNISLGVQFTENLDTEDDTATNWWNDVIEISVSNSANPQDAPSSRVPPATIINETIIVVNETIIVVNETIITPHLQISPEDQLVNINTNYIVEWQLFASHPYQYRVNISNAVLGENRTELTQTWDQGGNWTNGQIFSYNSPTLAEGNGTYIWTIEATDDYGNYFTDSIRVAVLNFTYYDEVYPGLRDDLGGDLGGIPVPLPLVPTFVAIFIMGLAYKKKRT